jgi:hypothetical protein
VSAKVKVVCPSTSRSYRLPRNLAERKVRRGGFRWVDSFTIEEVELDAKAIAAVQSKAAYYAGPLGRSSMLPCARVHVPNPLLKPEPLHYSIPACGAHSRSLHVSDVNYSPEVLAAK